MGSVACSPLFATFASLSPILMLPGFRRALSTCARLRHPAPARPKLKLATVHQGVQFEERSHRVLGSQMSMALTRVGGKSDGGVDLQGWWWLPPSEPSPSAGPALPTGRDSDPARRRIQVLGQCKAERGKLGPHYVREMEGVMLALRSEHQQPDSEAHAAVALLVSESGFTRGGLERARQSRVPFLLMHLPPHAADAHPDAIGGCIWNAALAGVLGPAFEVRWERAAAPDPDSPASGRPGLWWNGKRLPNWTPPAAGTRR